MANKKPKPASGQSHRKTRQRLTEKVTARSGPKQYPFLPLEQQEQEDATIEHITLEVIQYEIYIPAKVWDHRAVRAFRGNLFPNGFPGATILKTAIGLWEGTEEDTHIYRTIVSSTEMNAAANLRGWLQEEIGKMMAILAEWCESRQEVVLFTEMNLTASQSRMVAPARSPAPAEPVTQAEDDADME
jgi:hypothetical protein